MKRKLGSSSGSYFLLMVSCEIHVMFMKEIYQIVIGLKDWRYTQFEILLLASVHGGMFFSDSLIYI